MFKSGFKNGAILILGGAKSGKSTLALRLFDGPGLEHIFIATAEALDAEMKDRIKRHQVERGEKWTTVEEPLDIVARITELDRDDMVILIDCLTLWLNNLFMRHAHNHEEIYRQIDELAVELSNLKGIVILVSNEIGMGIVPENKLARDFRDAAEYMNQRIAAVAGKAVIVFAGMPVILKDE
ncbi:MAG TPA: bifunctional adenosylcobinamide kinase/adenosylcobinamide-phosphate guanylyltransferase [Desulfatiglandales bacterium]|nr:bifunctional adenosylcobinamide kinase/adenosylcobinamide-phosphate guanylyltransferase [Desulfatiglandales bacterium]